MKAVALEANGVGAVAARFAWRHHFGKREHVLSDDGVGANVGVLSHAAKLVNGAEVADVTKMV